MPLPENLDHKAGPLPVWAWLAAAGGVVTVIQFWRSRNSNATVADATPTSDGTVGGYGDSGTGSGSSGSSFLPDSTATGAGTTSRPTDYLGGYTDGYGKGFGDAFGAPMTHEGTVTPDPTYPDAYPTGRPADTYPTTGTYDPGFNILTPPNPYDSPTYTQVNPPTPVAPPTPVQSKYSGGITQAQLNQAFQERDAAYKDVDKYTKLYDQYQHKQYGANLEQAKKVAAQKQSIFVTLRQKAGVLPAK